MRQYDIESVWQLDSTTMRQFDNETVRQWDSLTMRQFDNETVCQKGITLRRYVMVLFHLYEHLRPIFNLKGWGEESS